ncbi:flagellar export chaperone FliS [Oxalobacter vibrioformis]|uniref:Flagellar export chaperone FliS n=1 Tax=Oxalobacter vibrioformis TaxID=933080 RepID=A0A9E9LWG9_9BURK|nr:flagellar export chaperone FliS [Oxalobacter vibrioformis]WAW09551.1 flagellar export chaperone FliS [Oxalobacter vibrioformis]
MFASSRHGANAYAKVGIETGVLAASPHKLITMLFDGALLAIATAAKHIESGNIEEKGQAIVKAVTIIQSGLQESLNREAGGELANNLDALYDYMRRRLFEAHVRNDASMLEEVKGLLLEIKSAWDEIGSTVDGNMAGAQAQIAPQSVQDPLLPAKPVLTRMRA